MPVRSVWRHVRSVLDLVYVHRVLITITCWEVLAYSVHQIVRNARTHQYVHNVLKGIT